MIGNDIIDISEALKINWERKGFLNKIFCKNEQDLILNSKNPGLMVWLLWSMKESAYKIFQRHELKRVFNPLKFKCQLTGINSCFYYGRVDFNNLSYLTGSEISADTISTIAVYGDADSLNKIIKGNIKCSSSEYSIQHQELYDFALEDISERIKKPAEELSIKKDLYGIPRLFIKNSQLSMPVSLSHHGSYAAYAIVNF
jgi:phosphopantetheinyl transferase (holo-ACP synthase)